MKSLCCFALMFGFSVLATADDKKTDAAFDAGKMVGTWKLTEGKKNGEALDDASKQGSYIIKKDKIHIQNDGEDMFVIEYTVDAKAKPVAIDMKIVKSPGDAANGSKALGILELTGDTLKLTYDPNGEKRPEKFDDDKMYCFTLKREMKANK